MGFLALVLFWLAVIDDLGLIKQCVYSHLSSLTLRSLGEILPGLSSWVRGFRLVLGVL